MHIAESREKFDKHRSSLFRHPGESMPEYVRRIDYEVSHFENQSSSHLGWHTHNDKRNAGECWICNIIVLCRILWAELEDTTCPPPDRAEQDVSEDGDEPAVS